MPNLSYLSPKTIVQASPIHGRGLFAREPIAQGEIVAIKGGYIFDSATLREVATRLGPADIPIADGFYIGPLTAGERDGGMIFSNHSCDPTIGIQGQIVFSRAAGRAAWRRADRRNLRYGVDGVYSAHAAEWAHELLPGVSDPRRA